MEPDQKLTGPTADATEKDPLIRGRSGRRGVVAGLVLLVVVLVGGTTAVASTNDDERATSGSGDVPVSSMVELMDKMHDSPEAQAMHGQLSPELRAQMEQMHAQMREMSETMGSMMGGEGMGGMGGMGSMMGGEGMGGDRGRH